MKHMPMHQRIAQHAVRFLIVAGFIFVLSIAGAIETAGL